MKPTKLILALLLSASSAFAAEFSTDASGMTAVNSGTNEREFFTGAPLNDVMTAAAGSTMTATQLDAAQRLVAAAGALLAQSRLVNMTDYHAEDAGVTLSMNYYLEGDYIVPDGYDVGSAVGVYVTLTATLQDPETWAPFDELIRDWYDVTGWSPDPSTVPLGQSFTQSKQQAQDWRRGERSSLGNERNVTAYNLTRVINQQATGTRPKATPTITWNPPSAIIYGTRLTAAQLNASASTSGFFSYSPGENVTLNAGENQPLTVTFTPTDTDAYTTATASTSITVTKAATTLTITAPTSSPFTLAIDSTATITTSLRRDHDAMAVSTALVTFAKGATTGTAAGTLASNVLTMTGGAGNDTIAITASYPGDFNHLPAVAYVTFRVPMPGSVVFGYPSPVASPVVLPDAHLFAEHGPTTSTFDFVLRNPGELAVEVTTVTISPQLGEVPSFQIVDNNGSAATTPFTVLAGATKPLKVRFRPVRYALNSDTIRFTWQCRPSATVLATGSTEWTLRGTGLKPILATMPRGSVADPNDPRDLAGQWPTLKSK